MSFIDQLKTFSLANNTGYDYLRGGAIYRAWKTRTLYVNHNKNKSYSATTRCYNLLNKNENTIHIKNALKIEIQLIGNIINNQHIFGKGFNLKLLADKEDVKQYLAERLSVVLRQYYPDINEYIERHDGHAEFKKLGGFTPEISKSIGW